MTSGHDPRGRKAKTIFAIPMAGWRDIGLRVWKESSDDSIGLIAAGVAFYGFLAFVPLLASFVLIYGLLADPTSVARHIQVLLELLPVDAANLIGEQLAAVTRPTAEKTGLGLIGAWAIALFGAMNAASAIITALNVAYDETEGRSLVVTTLLALGITIALIIVAVLAVLAIAALALVDVVLPGAPPVILTMIRLCFWSIAALAASCVIAFIYRYAPDRAHPRWHWLTVGSLFATASWLAGTLGFGLYVANIANYNATYGALSAVVILLMWLFLSAYVLILGAEINSEIEHQIEADTTVGEPRPMGERNAYVADTLGEVP